MGWGGVGWGAPISRNDRIASPEFGGGADIAGACYPGAAGMRASVKNLNPPPQGGAGGHKMKGNSKIMLNERKFKNYAKPRQNLDQPPWVGAAGTK